MKGHRKILIDYQKKQKKEIMLPIPITHTADQVLAAQRILKGFNKAVLSGIEVAKYTPEGSRLICRIRENGKEKQKVFLPHRPSEVIQRDDAIYVYYFMCDFIIPITQPNKKYWLQFVSKSQLLNMKDDFGYEL